MLGLVKLQPYHQVVRSADPETAFMEASILCNKFIILDNKRAITESYDYINQGQVEQDDFVGCTYFLFRLLLPLTIKVAID